jgi:hypothetical protein
MDTERIVRLVVHRCSDSLDARELAETEARLRGDLMPLVMDVIDALAARTDALEAMIDADREQAA